jgi:hypothetical protein
MPLEQAAPAACSRQLCFGMLDTHCLRPCPACATGADQTKQQQQQQLQPPSQQQDGEVLVQLQVFLQCFEVTFFYEPYLMALRAQAFNREKKCERARSLIAAACDHSSLCGVSHPGPRKPAQLMVACLSTRMQASHLTLSLSNCIAAVRVPTCHQAWALWRWMQSLQAQSSGCRCRAGLCLLAG